ncbi:MAG TPA: JDVT-CTERM system glutamic-type intramembrane protease [Burkholderiaceae bacterium]|jgi:uncharacterized protein|nr:JDVT-CTERM system glutamic-type intramembrane protease [Burkholderiaceae bacterium]
MPLQLLLAPVWEEVLFRGLLQGRLGRWRAGAARWKGITLANALTGAVFAAAHLLAHPPALAPGFFAVSLLLGIARERSGGLALPIALHAAFNLLGWIALAHLPPLG